MEWLFLIKIGEIALKGKNRNAFEKRLKENLRNKLKGLPIRLSGGWGRYYLSLPESEATDAAYQTIETAITTTFGIVGYARAVKVPKTADDIFQAIEAHLARLGRPLTTFKAESKRSDKSFPLTSMELNCRIGETFLQRYPGSKVDVHHPDVQIFVEIREAAYVYVTPLPAAGGLPVGTAGRGTLLLSGGIDSPVAGWMMAKRGLKLDALYFHAYPYTSNEAKEKVIALARLLAPWTDGLTLMIVPFTETQLQMNRHGQPEAATLFMRCAMMEIAHRITEQRGNKAIITGESLSQVASQTAESLRVTSSHTTYPVLRPLIGMDKEEIMRLARTIGTFETSILPYEDCCTLFSPKHPLIKPDFETLNQAFSRLQVEPFLEAAVSQTELLCLK